MKYILFIGQLLFCVDALTYPTTTQACTLESEVQHMLELDMVGDPTDRMSLAASQATTQYERNDELKLGVFELDTDPLELATGWKISGTSVTNNGNECVVTVIFHVVGKTKGSGIPAWNRNKSREIVQLDVPVDKTVQLRFFQQNKTWKLAHLPVPRVAPKVLRDYFNDEYQSQASIQFSPQTDKRAIKNWQVIQSWRQRQLDVLDKIIKSDTRQAE